MLACILPLKELHPPAQPMPPRCRPFPPGAVDVSTCGDGGTCELNCGSQLIALVRSAEWWVHVGRMVRVGGSAGARGARLRAAALLCMLPLVSKRAWILTAQKACILERWCGLFEP